MVTLPGQRNDSYGTHYHDRCGKQCIMKGMGADARWICPEHGAVRWTDVSQE